MKTLTLLLLSVTVGWSSAYLIKVPTLPTQPRIAPVGWVHIQRLMLPLFDNVCEDSTNTIIVQLAKDFTLDTSNGDYTKTGVVEYLRSLRTSKGFLPKGEIFTEYNKDHTSELKGVFELLYYAKDFYTFYRAAAWARQNLNCGLFVDAIYLAIVNRKDTERISVPAPYELMPNYFIDREVVVKASFLLTGDDITPPENVRIEGNAYIIDAKYTAEVDDNDDDAKLAYYREDIGLNSYYFIRKLRNSPWLNTVTDTNSMYGERMFQMMKQFAARYDLERYSNELPELEGFSWDSAVTAYDPMLIYSNGNEFDHRLFTGVLADNDDIAFLKTIENNLATVVTHLTQAGHNKSQILNHLIELLVTSDRSYETVAWKLLGFDTNGSERQCSVLEHYMTTMRDPVFWRINKKIVQLINNAMRVLPTYTRNELYFPGVEVFNVEIKKMITSFDNFQFDVTDSLKTTTANTTFQVKVSQPRLNHKPFIIKMNISSLVTKKACVKIYLGPKMMPGELAMKKHLFVLLDMFELSLKRGSNVVSRSSDIMTSFSDDFMSLKTLKKKVENAEFGLDALPLKTVESQIGYPSRLVLPKGLPGGLPLQMFVFVAPFTKSKIGGSTTMANMELNTAILSPGYPLDLPIETRQLFGLPNAFVKDIVITHKTESSSNGGYGGKPTPNRPYDFQTDFDVNRDDYREVPQENLDEFNFDDSLLVHGLLGDRPDFTYKKTDTNNNYSGNKSQYRMKNDYATKKTDYRKVDYSKKVVNKPEATFKGRDLDVDKIDVITKNDELAFDITPGKIVYQPEEKTYQPLPVHGLLSERPAFTYKSKDTTSYTANKNQYRKKEDYAAKRVDYKKVDYQDRAVEKTNDEVKVTDDPYMNNKEDPRIIYKDVITDKTDSKYISRDFSHGDTTNDSINVYDSRINVHGLLGKATDDYVVKKNKYQIKKDNYVQKAETKKIDNRKKAFDKKTKIGVFDYSLIENPKVNEDTILDDEDNIVLSKQVVSDKNDVDDKMIKYGKDKSVSNKIVHNKIKTGDDVSKEVENVEISVVPSIETDKIILEKVNPVEFLNMFDQVGKTINEYINKNIDKKINKNIDGTVVPKTTEDNFFSKTVKNDIEEIDFYDNDKVGKIINKDIVKNKDVVKHVMEDNSKDITFNSKDGFTKTVNKNITKNENTRIVNDDENTSDVVKDDSLESIVTTEATKKRFSVYDFILSPMNSEELRVYE